VNHALTNQPASLTNQPASRFTINPGRRDPCASLILKAGAERALAQRHRAGAHALSAETAGPVVVHIHAYYPELLSELLAPIAQSWPGPAPDLLITVPSDGTGHRLQACQHQLQTIFGETPPPCQWREVENRGRNLMPLLQVVQELISQGQPAPMLLHLHTKQTLDPEGIGNAWRGDLVNTLLGSRDQIALALRLLADPSVGLVMPCRYHGIEPHYHWGGNFAQAAQLVQQLFPGRTLHPDQLLQFPAGLMFWCRPEALRPLLALPLDEAHIPPEPLGTNGTVPHALERLICHSAEAAGWQWRLVDLEPNQQAEQAVVSAAEPQPSVWQRQSGTYLELLHQQLQAQQAQLHAEQQRSLELAKRLHQTQQHLRRVWLPRGRPPLSVALVLQRAGKGYISSAHLRLLEPMRLLEQQGLCRMQLVNELQPQELWGAELVIAQRGALADPAAADQLHGLCRQLGLPLVADIDDALCCLPADHAEQERYQGMAAATDRLLMHCDHAMFSTGVLASTYRNHLAAAGHRLQRVSVVANGLSARLWRPEQEGQARRRALKPGTPIHILYMGSKTHDDDFEMLLPQLDALAASHPGHFQLHVIGALNTPPERPWLQLREVPLKARRYPDFVPWLLKRRQYHFGIAPLRSNAFNAAKSDVKVLDYAALGLGSLCSTGPAYAGLIRRGLALGTANDQWQAALGQLLLDPRPIQRCGRRAERHLWRRRSCARVAHELWRVLQVHR
jgi:hypothetical protein